MAKFEADKTIWYNVIVTSIRFGNLPYNTLYTKSMFSALLFGSSKKLKYKILNKIYVSCGLSCT